MTKLISKVVDIVIVCLMPIMLFWMSFEFMRIMSKSWITIVGSAAVLGTVFLFLMLFKEKIKEICKKIYAGLSRLSVWQMMITLFLFSAVTKIITVFVLDNNTDVHNDMVMYRSFAEQLAETGRITQGTEYALKYNYTVFFSAFISIFAKLFGSDHQVLFVSFSLLISFVMVLLFDILRKYAGKEVSFFVLLVYCATPFGILQTQTLIHENGLLFFHIVALWIFLKAFDNKKHPLVQLLLVFVASFVLSMGKGMNASGRVFTIAFGIYAVAKIFEKGISFKGIAKVICVALALVVCYTGASKATTTLINSKVEGADVYQKNEFRILYGWSLYLGLNYDKSGYYNPEDYETYSKYQECETKEEAVEYQKNLIKDRVNVFVESPLKLPIHFLNKLRALWGSPYLYGISPKFSQVGYFVHNAADGLIYKIIQGTNQIVFIVAYALIFITRLSKLFKKSDAVNPHLYFNLCVIGVTAALILFEVNPKYASHLHILLFGVLALEIKNYFNLDFKKALKLPKKTNINK